MQTQKAFSAPVLPMHITKRAFQERFPLLLDGVSRKYDAMSMFLNDSEYAYSLDPNLSARTSLKLQITTGLNRLLASGYVDLGLPDAAMFTALLMQPYVPPVFRLSLAERNVILSQTIQDTERPS